MQNFFYFLLALGATTAGAMTGMGGGVIIKPLMDVLHGFDVESISVVSSITVFFMSIVSIGKQLLSKTEIPFIIAIPLSLGSVAGGYLGQELLQIAVSAFHVQAQVTVIQNGILVILILSVCLYMRQKDQILGKHVSAPWASLAVGCFLGICSSFLGIGGGPINIVLIIFLYSVSTKTATICSLMTILFAQISKLLTVAISTGFTMYDLSVAPTMVLGAIMGGLLGAELNKRCSEKTVESAFCIVQLIVLMIAASNIIRNIAEL